MLVLCQNQVRWLTLVDTAPVGDTQVGEQPVTDKRHSVNMFSTEEKMPSYIDDGPFSGIGAS